MHQFTRYHWRLPALPVGTRGQPQLMQQLPVMPPQGPMPASPYGQPQQPPSAEVCGRHLFGGGVFRNHHHHNNKIMGGQRTVNPPQCFSGAAGIRPDCSYRACPNPGIRSTTSQPSPGPQVPAR